MFERAAVWHKDSIILWSIFSSTVLPILLMLCSKHIVPKQRYHAFVLLFWGIIIQLIFCPWKFPERANLPTDTIGYTFVWNLSPFVMDLGHIGLSIFYTMWIAAICYHVKKDLWSCEIERIRNATKLWWCDVRRNASNYATEDTVKFLIALKQYVDNEYFRISSIQSVNRTIDDNTKFSFISKAYSALMEDDIIAALEALDDMKFQYKGKYIYTNDVLNEKFHSYIKQKALW